MNKQTEDLVSEIKTSATIADYMAKNSREQTNVNLSEYLRELLKQKGLNRKYVYDKGNIAKSYGDQILNGKKINISRDIVLKLCFGLELDIDQSQRLLRMGRSGSLYARDKRDSVIMFCLENKKTISECNLLLDDLNIKLLLGKDFADDNKENI